MASLYEKIAYLAETKGRIKNAINAFGNYISNDTPFRDYASIISNITPNSGINPNNLLYSFGMVSDIHLGSGAAAPVDFTRALNVFKNNEVDFAVCCGDIGEGEIFGHTREEEGLRFANAVAPFSNDFPVYACKGNHDRAFTNAEWLLYVGHDRNFAMEQGNDAFLFMSMDEKDTIAGMDHEPYKEAGLPWLKEKIDLYTGRRIFLIMHFPISYYAGLKRGEYYGFSSTCTEDDEIMSLIHANKNIIVLSGHSHFQFECEEDESGMNITQLNNSNSAMVHVPSTAYPRNYNKDADYDKNQGYIVDVYDNCVVFNAYDFCTGLAMDKYTYTVPCEEITEITNSIIVKKEINMDGGTTAALDVKLGFPISGDLTVSLYEEDAIEISVTSLTFTSENYDIPQTVTITAPAAYEDDMSPKFNITLSAEGCVNKIVNVNVSYVPVEYPSSNPLTMVVGRLSRTDGGERDEGEGVRSHFVDISASGGVILFSNTLGNNGCFLCYDEYKQFMLKWNGEYNYKHVTSGSTLTIPSGCKYVRIYDSSVSDISANAYYIT